MKKYIFIMVVNVIVVICGVGYFLNSKVEITPLAYRFTFVYPQVWNDMIEGTPDLDMMEDDGTNTKCVSFENFNESEQIEAIQKAIYAKVDGIITCGTRNSEDLIEVINQAEKEGIPVVLIDSDIPESDRSGYIGADSCKAGEMAGVDMAEATHENAKIGIVVSGLDNTNQAQKAEGFQKVTDSYEGMEVIQILECDSDKIKTRKLVMQMLNEHPEINAIYCADMVSSEIVGEILENMGYGAQEMQVVCSSMSDIVWSYLQEGRYYSAIVQNIYSQGSQAVKYLKDYLNGKTDTETIDMELMSVKQDFDFGEWTVLTGSGEAIWKTP